MEEFTIPTHKKYELIDITEKVEGFVAKELSGKDGICLIFIPHATAAVMLEENEEGLKDDFYEFFQTFEKFQKRHPDANAESHILAGVIGQERVIPVEKGNLVLGTWQSVLLVELDGPRNRRVIVQTISK